MSNEWVGIVKTTTPRYLREVEDLTIRKRLFLKWMESKGNIVLNCDSYEQNWLVEAYEGTTTGYADGASVQYAPVDRYEEAKMDWRALIATDLLTKKRRLMNKGTVARVNLYKKILPRLTNQVRNKLGTELYIDGNASGNQNRLCGLGTWANSDAGTITSGDKVHQPDDTYMELDTDVGTDGTWTTNLSTYPNAAVASDWPEGSGDAEYDFWSPKLVNTSCTNWVDSSHTTWSDTCEEVLRATVQWLSHTADSEGDDLLCMTSGKMMTDFKGKMSALRRDLLPHPMARDLGFPDTLNFEGLAIKSEFGVAENTGWVSNIDKLMLCALTGTLLDSDGPDWDPDTLSWKFSVQFWGNLKCISPKYFAKLYPYA